MTLDPIPPHPDDHFSKTKRLHIKIQVCPAPLQQKKNSAKIQPFSDTVTLQTPTLFRGSPGTLKITKIIHPKYKFIKVGKK